MSFYNGFSNIIPTSCRRRSRILAPLASDIFFARGYAGALTVAAWLALFGMLTLLRESTQLRMILLPGLCLFVGLCLISLYDARYFVIPDAPLIVLSLCAPFVWPALDVDEASRRVFAAAIAYASLRFVAHAYEAMRGEPGLGDGDAKLYAVAGLWLGMSGLPGCLIYAALSALVSAVIALRLGALADARAPLPFGPHLALGLWLSFALGPLELG
jgi:leader peptidase (prepilin peptidase) / N-methyltransferase